MSSIFICWVSGLCGIAHQEDVEIRKHLLEILTEHELLRGVAPPRGRQPPRRRCLRHALQRVKVEPAARASRGVRLGGDDCGAARRGGGVAVHTIGRSDGTCQCTP